MALRSQIGSSLVAKANPASPIRKTEESKIANPAIPGKGDAGSLGRKFVEQPFLRPIPEGSARTVSVTPNVEAGAISTPTNPLPEPAGGNIVPGVGQPQGQSQLRSGANNQALFQGGVSTPASAPGKAGTVAKSVSGAGKYSAPINPKGQVSPEGAASTYQAETVNPFTGKAPSVSQLSGHVSAGETGGKPNLVTHVPATSGQVAAGSIGKVLSNIGTALKAPQIVPGGLGAKLQTFGGAPAVAQQGIGSVSAGLRSVVQTVNNVVSKLRSLFKK